MIVLIYGLTIFCLAFLVHLLVWKIHLPKNHTSVLMWIFFSILFLCFIGSRFIFPNITIFEYIHITLLYFFLVIAYVLTYVAIEVDSPSLVIVMNIANAGKDGLETNSLSSLITDDKLVKPRIEDLVVSKLIYLNSGVYKLSIKGKLFIRPFIFYKKLIKRGKGG